MEIMNLEEAVAVFDDYSQRLKICRELATKHAGVTFKDAAPDDSVKSSLDIFDRLFKQSTAESIIILERIVEQRGHLINNLPALTKFLQAQNNLAKEIHASCDLLQKIRPDTALDPAADPLSQPKIEGPLARAIRKWRADHGFDP